MTSTRLTSLEEKVVMLTEDATTTTIATSLTVSSSPSPASPPAALQTTTSMPTCTNPLPPPSSSNTAGYYVGSVSMSRNDGGSVDVHSLSGEKTEKHINTHHTINAQCFGATSEEDSLCVPSKVIASMTTDDVDKNSSSGEKEKNKQFSSIVPLLLLLLFFSTLTLTIIRLYALRVSSNNAADKLRIDAIEEVLESLKSTLSSSTDRVDSHLDGVSMMISMLQTKTDHLEEELVNSYQHRYS